MTCKFYSFMKAVRGNWRNAIYIQCGQFGIHCSCDGFFMAADQDGKPILLSSKTLHSLTGELIDPEECSAILNRRSFESAFSLFIKWNSSDSSICPLCQLCLESNL